MIRKVNFSYCHDVTKINWVESKTTVQSVITTFRTLMLIWWGDVEGNRVSKEYISENVQVKCVAQL